MSGSPAAGPGSLESGSLDEAAASLGEALALWRGNHAMLTQRLAGWVSAYPLRENLHGSYIVALARSGTRVLRSSSMIASIESALLSIGTVMFFSPSER